MDIRTIVAELKSERDQLNKAIAALENLNHTQPAVEAGKVVSISQPVRTMVRSTATRKRMSLAQKRLWRERKKAA